MRILGRVSGHRLRQLGTYVLRSIVDLTWETVRLRSAEFINRGYEKPQAAFPGSRDVREAKKILTRFLQNA
jgi:hypothetical protein